MYVSRILFRFRPSAARKPKSNTLSEVEGLPLDRLGTLNFVLLTAFGTKLATIISLVIALLR